MLSDGDVVGMRWTQHPDLQLRTRRAGAPLTVGDANRQAWTVVTRLKRR